MGENTFQCRENFSLWVQENQKEAGGISKRKQLATYYRDEMPNEGTEDRVREGQRPSALKSNINYEQ